MRAKNGTNRKDIKFGSTYKHDGRAIVPNITLPFLPALIKDRSELPHIFYLVLPCILSMYIYILERNKKKSLKTKEDCLMHPVSILS